MEKKSDITLKQIFLFWLPLASTWIMMAAELPYISAVIARLTEAEFNLAAFGVAYNLAVLFESPIIMLMSSSLKLVKGRRSYLKLRQFSVVLNVAITLLMALFLIPPIFNFVTKDLIGLPDRIAHLTHISTAILLFWPAAIGMRRFYQGILIRANSTRKVAYGTLVRLLSMSGSAIVLYYLGMPGAYTGATALTFGVILETLATRMMAGQAIKNTLKTTGDERKDPNLRYREILKFYIPLSLTTIVSLAVPFIVIFFVGQGRFPIESLAVLPVVNGLVFMFRSMGLSFQEVGIAFMGDKNEGYGILKKFASMLGMGVFVSMAIIAFTPLSHIWFHHISGLSLDLTGFSKVPTQIMVIIPLLSVWISFQRAYTINSKRTILLSNATFIEVGMIVAVLIVTISFMDMIGAIAAALAYLVGRLFSNLYLHYSIRNHRQGLIRG